MFGQSASTIVHMHSTKRALASATEQALLQIDAFLLKLLQTQSLLFEQELIVVVFRDHLMQLLLLVAAFHNFDRQAPCQLFSLLRTDFQELAHRLSSFDWKGRSHPAAPTGMHFEVNTSRF